MLKKNYSTDPPPLHYQLHNHWVLVQGG
ncbi:hypothetical protein AYI69_g8468, partial [Smittium culicis]